MFLLTRQWQAHLPIICLKLRTFIFLMLSLMLASCATYSRRIEEYRFPSGEPSIFALKGPAVAITRADEPLQIKILATDIDGDGSLVIKTDKILCSRLESRPQTYRYLVRKRLTRGAAKWVEVGGTLLLLGGFGVAGSWAQLDDWGYEVLVPVTAAWALASTAFLVVPKMSAKDYRVDEPGPPSKIWAKVPCEGLDKVPLSHTIFGHGRSGQAAAMTVGPERLVLQPPDLQSIGRVGESRTSHICMESAQFAEIRTQQTATRIELLLEKGRAQNSMRDVNDELDSLGYKSDKQRRSGRTSAARHAGAKDAIRWDVSTDGFYQDKKSGCLVLEWSVFAPFRPSYEARWQAIAAAEIDKATSLAATGQYSDCNKMKRGLERLSSDYAKVGKQLQDNMEAYRIPEEVARNCFYEFARRCRKQMGQRDLGGSRAALGAMVLLSQFSGSEDWRKVITETTVKLTKREAVEAKRRRKEERRRQEREDRARAKANRRAEKELSRSCRKWRDRYSEYGSCENYCGWKHAGNRGGLDLGYDLCMKSCVDCF